MVEARTRKQELIQNQKRQIQRMKEEMVGLLGQRAIDDMQDRIGNGKKKTSSHSLKRKSKISTRHCHNSKLTKTKVDLIRMLKGPLFI